MFQTLIASTTVGAGGSSTIDFTAIPATYTDLTLILSARATSTTATITVAFNGSATSFATRYVQGDGASGSTATGTTLVGRSSISTDTTSTFGNFVMNIANYSGSQNKTFTIDVATENNASTAYVQSFTSSWANTAAITQVSLSLANFAQYSTAYLYGTLKGSGGATVS